MNSVIQSTLLTLLIPVLFCCNSGCQLIHGAKLATLPTATPENPVIEIICVWQPGEGTGLDGLPTRGFAGQVIFFAMGQTAPVRVDGKVRIYVFDDQGTEEEQMQPIHQFDFDSSSFQSFLTQTNLGAAYQLFIPYTRKGTHNANCTLRVRYTPDEGSAVYSKMATVTLSGTTKRKPDQSVELAAATSMGDTGKVATLLAEIENEGRTEKMSPATIPTAPADTANAEEKKKLRETLSSIASVAPAATPASPPAAAPQEHPVTAETTGRMKLHPLAAAPVAESKAPPVEASPAAEAAPAKDEGATQEDAPVKEEAPAAAAAPANHPLSGD